MSRPSACTRALSADSIRASDSVRRVARTFVPISHHGTLTLDDDNAAKLRAENDAGRDGDSVTIAMLVADRIGLETCPTRLEDFLVDSQACGFEHVVLPYQVRVATVAISGSRGGMCLASDDARKARFEHRVDVFQIRSATEYRDLGT